MATLAETVKEVTFSYAGGGFGIEVFPLANENLQVYAINVIDTPVRHQPAGVVVLVRIVDNKVIIEEDTTDRPLVDALIHAGIPRENIVLAYAGETIN
jgi:hypothetical protein